MDVPAGGHHCQRIAGGKEEAWEEAALIEPRGMMGRAPKSIRALCTGRDDWAVLASIGMLVVMIGSVAHEVIGHGLGCALDGGTITLVTFLVFRCDGASWLADGGGPIGAFAVGCFALLIAHVSRTGSGLLRLSSFTVASVLLFWVFAQMVREAFDGSDDWGHVARDLHWPSEWHLFVAVIGVIGYVLTLRLMRQLAVSIVDGQPPRLIIPYLAAALSAPLLGALWHGGATASALDGFLTFAIAPFGHLMLLTSIDRKRAPEGAISRNHAFVGVALITFVLFAVLIAPGLGRLSL
ncbi:hypothetical protein L2Y96_02785 [Luteibacter aegosomaticola]|uniref:hypothetical protein n=1 Tax=Luteibacter aegosomaticola TaxID=2911538 RepID=UPI001FFAC65F|nr:hypothetical protein [Luteibacter aegosomaticola]UPG90716.1 hypothetical protein L2Y96_02785 [Luteibacter aegosomaticola]